MYRYYLRAYFDEQATIIIQSSMISQKVVSRLDYFLKKKRCFLLSNPITFAPASFSEEKEPYWLDQMDSLF